MLQLILLSIIQTMLLAVAQTSTKVAMSRTGDFNWSWGYFKTMFINWPMGCAALSTVIALGLWFYILKHWSFSLAYPLQSLAYIWGMLIAALFLHENIVPLHWLGVVLIMGGVALILIK